MKDRKIQCVVCKRRQSEYWKPGIWYNVKDGEGTCFDCHLGRPVEKYYISGAITNNPNYKEDFEKAEKQLREKYPKAIIVNPIEICSHLPEGSSWEEYMRVCIKYLLWCDKLFMIQNIFESKGADMEMYIALKLNLEIGYL